MPKIKSAKKLAEIRKQLAAAPRTPFSILISLGTCGIAAGTLPVRDALNEELASRKLGKSVTVTEVGCMGLCYAEPVLMLTDNRSGKSLIYGSLSPADIPAILDGGADRPAEEVELVERTWYYPETESPAADLPQARIVLRNTGVIEPESIEQYIGSGGYQALGEALGMKPQQVIDVILASGLRGRGGGGFPTGRKWQAAADQPAGEKFLICNADEGDPGAFMDRAVLEGDPHSVLEGMIIGGYAIGAGCGVIYVRAEYPLAVQRLELAIEQAKKWGFLGRNIFGSGFDFEIMIRLGAGAFVCGEETALIHSVEGKRGEPTVKPPYPAARGLWGKPTVVNNVETLACIAAIVRKGADWFKSIGTAASSGTKVFALAGKIERVGLVEVPMGTPLRKIIFDIGNGCRNQRKFKAVQTGGPSGGCITADQLDLAIDYDVLRSIGSMMGSGGMIVMDEDDCMVDIAKFFLRFTLDESCGKCTPCRVGNRRMYEILDHITSGRGSEESLDRLKTLAQVIKDTALCGLGQTSPNPVLSMMANFEEEYRAHAVDGRCPAWVCARLISYYINAKCVGCGLCRKNCPVDCIIGEPKQRHTIVQKDCVKCGTCYSVCKFKAIEKK